MEDNKRLIPLKVTKLDNENYNFNIDGKDYKVSSDEEGIRRAFLRLKVKNGDGKDAKRSSKNSKYMDMLDSECYIWKSKVPADEESLHKLTESTNDLFVDYVCDYINKLALDNAIDADLLVDYMLNDASAREMFNQYMDSNNVIFNTEKQLLDNYLLKLIYNYF